MVPLSLAMASPAELAKRDIQVDVPEDLAPDELTPAKAEELFATGHTVAGDGYAAEMLGRALSRRVAELAGSGC